jgi:hypothetical protein
LERLLERLLATGMERAQVRHVLRLEPKAEEPLRPFLAIAQVVEHVLQLVHVAHLWGRGAVVSTACKAGHQWQSGHQVAM